MDGQVTWSDLGISFGRTLSEHSAATEDGTSTPCWKKLRVSQNQDFLYLDCRKSGNGQKQEPLTVMGGLSLGELTTLKTGEKPSETAVQEMLSVWGPHSVAEESRLSQIGVGEPGDPANTISAAHSHGVFATAIPINDKATRWQGGGESRNHDGSGNGLGIGKEGDPSPTLTAGDRHGVMCMNPWDAQSARVYDQDGAWHSLNANENGGMARDSVLCAGFKAGQGAQAGGIGYSEEVSPTLAAAPSGTNQTPAVVALDMTHACDVIRECGEQAPSLQARMGTGGNQVPLTYQDVTGTLSPGAHSGSYNGQDAYNDMLVCGATPEVAHALRAKASCAYREDAETYPVQNMVARRLTPLECERLQGFPDGWTDIGDYTDSTGKKRKTFDSARYKALGNSIALPFWRWMFGRMAAYLPDGATLGSLFDGIGGFPLCWENIHGAGTAIWASEIEPFPIAVTKKHSG